MNRLVFALGVLLVLTATIDPLWTVFWVDGHAGPVTRRYGQWIDGFLSRVVPRRKRRLVSLIGPLVLVASVTLWALLLWLSWTVLLSADPGALLDPHTREHPTLAGRIYYVGYTLFTTGNGDYSPQGALWQTASSLASMSGLFLLTLSVTYLLAVIGAVVGKRSFASQVWTLGHSAEDLVIAAWNGRGFPAVELQLVSLTQQLNTITEQHQAYPMLHYYHEERLPQAASVNLTVNELGVRRRLLMGFLEEELRDWPSPGRYPK